MKKYMYEIIDDFLSIEDLENLKSVLLKNDFLWNISEDMNHTTLFLESIHYENHKPNSNFYNYLVPIMKKMQVLGLVEAKSNLYFGTTYFQSFKKEKRYNFSLGTGIFYLNTNNGYTLLEDGSKIGSIENRMVLFEPTTDYYESNCTDSTCRANITFNYF